MPRLSDIAKEIGNSVGTRERITPLFRRLKELETYMDPTYGENKGVTQPFSSFELLVHFILISMNAFRKFHFYYRFAKTYNFEFLSYFTF